MRALPGPKEGTACFASHAAFAAVSASIWVASSFSENESAPALITEGCKREGRSMRGEGTTRASRTRATHPEGTSATNRMHVPVPRITAVHMSATKAPSLEVAVMVTVS